MGICNIFFMNFFDICANAFKVAIKHLTQYISDYYKHGPSFEVPYKSNAYPSMKSNFINSFLVPLPK